MKLRVPQRTTLRPIALADALDLSRAKLIVTMRVGQWDALLDRAYAEGAVLVELDDAEVPVRAYQKAEHAGAGPQ